VYYIVAGGWYKLGAMLGAKIWALAYWVRFLNAGVYVFFCLDLFLVCGTVYPDRDFLAWGFRLSSLSFLRMSSSGLPRHLSPLFVALALLLLFDAMREGVSSTST